MNEAITHRSEDFSETHRVSVFYGKFERVTKVHKLPESVPFLWNVTPRALTSWKFKNFIMTTFTSEVWSGND